MPIEITWLESTALFPAFDSLFLQENRGQNTENANIRRNCDLTPILEKREELKKAGWDLDHLCSYVCKLFSIEADQILRKGRANDVSRAKNLISFWASRELGISSKEIADYFGVSSPAISYSIKQGEKYARENDVKLLF